MSSSRKSLRTSLPPAKPSSAWRFSGLLLLISGLSVGLGVLAGARTPTAALPAALPTPTAAELRDADARVRSMDEEQLFELRRKRDTFYSLPAARQAELRQFYAQLKTHPQSDRLMTVLKRFYSWYRSLDAISQPRILDETDLEKRVTAIQRLMREQASDANVLPFSNRDLELVEKWVDDFSKNRKEQLKQVTDRLSRDPGGDNPGMNAVVRMMFRGDIAPDALFRRLINFSFAPGREDITLLKLVSDEDLNQLFASFSAEGQTQVPEGREAQLRLLWTLVRRPYASEEDLHKFYVQELTPEQRDSLDRMSPERMNRELKQLYIQKKYQLPGRRGGGLQGGALQPGSRN